MSWQAVVAMVLGLFICSCTPREFDQATDLVGVNKHIERCRDLDQAKIEIQPSLDRLSQAERDRLREINEVHRVACSADLAALANEVRGMKEALP